MLIAVDSNWRKFAPIELRHLHFRVTSRRPRASGIRIGHRRSNDWARQCASRLTLCKTFQQMRRHLTCTCQLANTGPRADRSEKVLLTTNLLPSPVYLPRFSAIGISQS